MVLEGSRTISSMYVECEIVLHIHMDVALVQNMIAYSKKYLGVLFIWNTSM